MSFNSPFTGNVVQPTDVSYRRIILTAVLQLEWPINGTTTDDAAARSLSRDAMVLFHEKAQSLATLQKMCEATLLLVIIVAFVVVGFFSLRRISGALQQLSDSQQVQQQARPMPVSSKP
jgi:hypothetical protein